MTREVLLVTGAEGMLGTELCRQGASDHRIIGTDVGDMDVTDLDLVRRIAEECQPTLIIHGAALTDVDGCEKDQDLAHRVNALGTRNMARVASEAGIPIVYVSTDYVFDGKGTRPYIESDPVNPQSSYGRTKLEGERYVQELCAMSHWIVRTQWVYGFSGKNFVDTILAAARAGKPLRVVDDQVGSPTWARDLARAILLLIDQRPASGIYHGSSNGECSWFEYTGEILREAGVEPVSLEPMKSSELDRLAPRPAYSVMRNAAFEDTMGDPMPDWRDSLKSYIAAREERGPANES